MGYGFSLRKLNRDERKELKGFLREAKEAYRRSRYYERLENIRSSIWSGFRANIWRSIAIIYGFTYVFVSLFGSKGFVGFWEGLFINLFAAFPYCFISFGVSALVYGLLYLYVWAIRDSYGGAYDRFRSKYDEFLDGFANRFRFGEAPSDGYDYDVECALMDVFRKNNKNYRSPMGRRWSDDV